MKSLGKTFIQELCPISAFLLEYFFPRLCIFLAYHLQAMYINAVKEDKLNLYQRTPVSHNFLSNHTH